jgi:hypothetical protein
VTCDITTSAAISVAHTCLQKLLRTISDMQKDFDTAALDNQRKERLHAVTDDTASRGASGFSLGSGSDFTSTDAATPLLNQQQQRVQVMRVGGKEVVQHDIAAVEAVRVPSSPLPAPRLRLPLASACPSPPPAPRLRLPLTPRCRSFSRSSLTRSRGWRATLPAWPR